MKIVSFNVNGIRASMKKGLFDTIQEINADVIGFQETKATEPQVSEALFGIHNYSLEAYSAERPGYSGTAALSKENPISVLKGIGKPEHDNEGRTLTLEFEKIFVVICYVPNSGAELVRLDYREQWDKDFLVFLKELEAKKPVVFIGDLNVAHQPIDLANPKSNYNKSAGYTQREIDGLSNFINAGFVDSFRHLYPETVKYSWWSARFNSRAKNVGWRIDYCLISESLKPYLKEAFILNDVMGSDHCPVGVVLDI